MRRILLLIVYLVTIPFLISCAGTSGTPPQAVTVSVTPLTASVIVGQMKQFSATVTGTNITNVTWFVAGGAANGTISSGGLYTAPAAVPTPASVTITATSQADTSKSSSATVTVTANTSNITVVISPNPVNVPNFGSQQFTAAVSGTSNTAVNWEVNGTAGGSQGFGYISSAGLYFAPSGVPTKATSSGGSVTTTVTVNAVSQANASASGSATVTLVPANQSAGPLPINLGTSGGNANDSSTNGSTITCCGGTLGALVVRGGTQYILSNTHVLARTDLSPAAGGDPIIQPGLVDVNCNKGQATNVANLSQYYNLETGSAPKIDAAIAQVVPGAVSPTGGILYLGSSTDANGVPIPGAPNGGPGVAATVNMAVAKSGRSTGLTCSTVFSTMQSTSVQYQKGCGTGTTFTVNYTGQVDVAGGSFSAEGDSGSLIVTQSNADPVALLYAGSDTDAVGNPVSDILNFFKSGSNSVTFAGAPRSNQQVIGCTLPLKPASATLTVPAATVATEGLQKAIAARDAHDAELMAHPEVQAVGVGASYDHLAEPAILLFVAKGQPRTNLPGQVDGVRTRIIEGEFFPQRGSLSVVDSATLEKSAPPPQLIYSVPDAEVARAKIVHAAHADEWMNKAGVQGVGIGSSADAPGEAALIIFLIRGDSHDPIPPVIDGLRTRVREGSRFRAGIGEAPLKAGCSLPAARTAKTSTSTGAKSRP